MAKLGRFEGMVLLHSNTQCHINAVFDQVAAQPVVLLLQQSRQLKQQQPCCKDGARKSLRDDCNATSEWGQLDVSTLCWDTKAVMTFKSLCSMC